MKRKIYIEIGCCEDCPFFETYDRFFLCKNENSKTHYLEGFNVKTEFSKDCPLESID